VQVLGSSGGAVATYGQSLDTTTNATVYSEPWRLSAGSVCSTHIEFAGGSSLTTVVTLWVSNKYEPDEADDDDWVNTGVSYTGITTGTSGKEAQALGNAGFKWYRLKLATSNGTGKVSAWVELTGLGRA
jgi:hypothetical protein